jgi:hypothetical protein
MQGIRTPNSAPIHVVTLKLLPRLGATHDRARPRSHQDAAIMQELSITDHPLILSRPLQHLNDWNRPTLQCMKGNYEDQFLFTMTLQSSAPTVMIVDGASRQIWVAQVRGLPSSPLLDVSSGLPSTDIC